MIAIERPLVVLDVEATGVNTAEDRIVELSIARYVVGEAAPHRSTNRINPGIPIPRESTEIHGITDADVAECPLFAHYARSILDLLTGCDYAGFNLTRYDLPIVEAELARCGLGFAWHEANVIDAYRIFVQMQPRNLAAAVQFYLGREHVDAHGADADVGATIAVLEAQLDGRYPELVGEGMEWLDHFCRYEDAVDRAGRIKISAAGCMVFGFGKHEGQPILEHRDYLRWMLNQQFPTDTQRIIREAMA